MYWSRSFPLCDCCPALFSDLSYAAERDFLAPLQHSHLAAASTLSPDCHYFIGAKPSASTSAIVMSEMDFSIVRQSGSVIPADLHDSQTNRGEATSLKLPG